MNDTKRVVKLSFIIITIIIFILLLIFILYNRYTIRFNGIIVDDDKYYSLMKNKYEYENDIINLISFNGNKLFDVADTNEFFYSMVEKDRNKYDPYIRIKSNLDNIELAILNKNITDELIANNEHIKLLAYNDTFYKEYEIIVTTLPIMNISYEENDENNSKLDIKGEDIYGELYLFDNNNNQTDYSNLKIHVRGLTSAYNPKKGYKLSVKDTDGISKNLSILDMREDDDWILYPMYDDHEKVRNVFASKVWYDCCSNNNYYGITAGFYFEYIELFINGKYHGLYSIGFPIDKKQLALSDKDILYKKENWFENKNDLYYYSYEIKSGENTFEPLADYFENINSLSNDELYKLVDIDNNIDFYLFNLFIQNTDGAVGMKSKNLYILLKYTGDKYIVLYIPWDLDLTFGASYLEYDDPDDVSDNNIGYKIKYDDNKYVHQDSAIGKLVKNKDELTISMIKNRYNNLRTNNWSDSYFSTIIDEYQGAIFSSGAYLRDNNRWPNSSYDKKLTDLSNFKKYVYDRIDSMDEFINNL